MGDRANVEFIEQDGEGTLFLYTHCGGSELPAIVQRALKRKQRWDDGAYLARIIFCEMVKGYETGESYFGISTYIGDGQNQIVTVDISKQEVRIRSQTWSFAQFIEVECLTYEPTSA